MSKESSQPDFREQSVTIDQAWRIVWGAGNIALSRSIEAFDRQIIADELGRMFSRIDEVRELSEIVKEEMPGSGPITFKMNDIMMSMDYRKNLIYQREQMLHDGQLNPFAIHDPELPAIESLSLYIQSAHNDITSE